MPWGAAVDTNGLKSRVTLFSGELSMTSVAPVVLVGAELLLMRRPRDRPQGGTAATSASALLLGIGLIVNFDCPLGRYFTLTVLPRNLEGAFLFLGDVFYFGGYAACGDSGRPARG